jgi:hypothetical protein
METAPRYARVVTTYRNAAEHFTLRERSTIPATNAFREAVPPFHATPKPAPA